MVSFANILLLFSLSLVLTWQNIFAFGPLFLKSVNFSVLKGSISCTLPKYHSVKAIHKDRVCYLAAMFKIAKISFHVDRAFGSNRRTGLRDCMTVNRWNHVTGFIAGEICFHLLPPTNLTIDCIMWLQQLRWLATILKCFP